ncbi:MULTISPECIES: sporulation protein YqfC [unclassified Oceanobacillus]|uniref:sporulation protein YqfC n=1 Tax=unclassified Oceanobacillus TaxID=2630292 RepID=UPI00300E3AC6
MKKWHLKFRNLMVNYLALPSDILLELPRLTMIGNFHLYIENHKGLETYSETELKLKTTNGYVQILGTSFVLKQMLPEEILLEGEIEEIKYIPSSL